MGALPIFLIIALLLDEKLSIIRGLVVTTLVVSLIKFVTNQFPENSAVFQMSRRPKGARCCDILSFDSSDQSKQPGFPSGHMAFISYFIMCSPKDSILQVILNVAMWLLMAHDRMTTNCHTLFQVISGSLLGIVVNKLI